MVNVGKYTIHGFYGNVGINQHTVTHLLHPLMLPCTPLEQLPTPFLIGSMGPLYIHLHE